MAAHNFNTIIKIAFDTTFIGLITDDDEAAYREVRDLAVWGQDNNHSLDISKTKKLILAYTEQRGEHAAIHNDGAVGECIERLKILSVHITKELTWSTQL